MNAQLRPELLKSALGLIDRLLGPVKLNHVAARDHANTESVTDESKVLVPASKQEDSFLPAIERNGTGYSGILGHALLR